MFFSGTFTDAGLLHKTIGVLHELVNECSATISENGVFIQAMDASHVCLVALDWPADSFKSFTSNGSIRIGLHVGNLLKILKCSNKSDSVTLAIDEDTADTLSIAFSDNDRTATFCMRLLDRDDDQLSVPEMMHDALVAMPSLEFLAACRDLSTLSDTTTVTVDANGLTLVSHGDIGSATLTYAHVRVDKPNSLSQTFALRYMNSFAKGSQIAPCVTLKMSENMPLEIAFENGVSHLTFYLAPKIDDELVDDD